MSEFSKEQTDKPWVAIEALLGQGDPGKLDAFLHTLKPAEVARAISRLDEDDQAQLLTLLEPEDAADLIEELSDTQGSDLIEDLTASEAAAIVDEMDSDHRADILGEMDEDDAEAILREMDPEEAEEARQLLSYPPETAGGIMVTEFVVYNQDKTVGDVLSNLNVNAEAYSDLGVQYAYVESDNGTLIGVLRLWDLVMAQVEAKIASVMIVNPISVLVDARLEELEQLFDRYAFSGLPVTDHDGKIVGVVRLGDVEEAHSERSERIFMRFSGIIGGDELRSMPTRSRSIQRLWWLTLNLSLSILAAFVIIWYQDTVDRVIALAALIPILANVSGCSGNQAVAVSIREMTLGLIQPRDALRVLRQELQVGFFNGLAVGLFLGAFTYVWKANIALSVIVGSALALNTLLAVGLGGIIPLILKRFNIDPAAAAAPMLTTIIDMCGFFLILSLASAIVT